MEPVDVMADDEDWGLGWTEINNKTNCHLGLGIPGQAVRGDRGLTIDTVENLDTEFTL